MNRKISLGLAVSLIAITAAVTFIITSFFSLKGFNEKVIDVNEKAKKYNALQILDSYVRDNYYQDIDEDGITSGILNGYISGLGDGQSRYLTAEEYKEYLAEESGELVGIGLVVSESEKGYIQVEEIIDDSPASESQLVVGDLITAVDGLGVIAEGYEKSVKSLSGKTGSEVVLTVQRLGLSNKQTLIRRDVEIQTVSGEIRDGRIGYIKIDSFRKNTPAQFKELFESFSKRGADKFVIDIRDNSGGLIESVEASADPLLPRRAIAFAEYNGGSRETIISSDDEETDFPIMLLVNKNTAGEAELFAAALRDFEKAKLVGEQTFGNGIMQKTAELSDGSAVVLTVAKYKPALSKCFDGEGLNPDYVINTPPTEESDPQYDMASQLLIG